MDELNPKNGGHFPGYQKVNNKQHLHLYNLYGLHSRKEKRKSEESYIEDNVSGSLQSTDVPAQIHQAKLHETIYNEHPVLCTLPKYQKFPSGLLPCWKLFG